jgi:ATP-binding cassette subfamily B protein
LRTIQQIAKLVISPIALSLFITHLATGDYDGAIGNIWLFALSSTLVTITSPLTRYIGMKGENKVYSGLTADYFHKLITTDIEYFNSNMSGYLTSSTRQFVDAGLELVRFLRQNLLVTLASLLFPLIVIFCYDAVLGLACLALGIIQATYILWSSNLLNKLRAKVRELYRRNSGHMSDAISNVVAIRAAAQEKTFAEQVRSGAQREAAAFSKRYATQSKLLIGREILSTVFFVGLLVLTIVRAQTGQIDLTAAVLTVTYMMTIIAAIYSLSEDVMAHDDFVDKIIPAFDIIDRENQVQDPPRPVKFESVRGNIKFDKVSFSYVEQTGSQAVFDSFSLAIPAGQKVGVVGVSGAGKSTLTKLILRFDDVASGAITIDDHDIRAVRQTDLHRQIAYVPQEPLLFHASIRDNVIVSKSNANDKEIEQALRAAHAWDFVQDLPNRLDSVVGERGVKLSSGQKQRVAIARAFLQHAPIMILDEATSALDSESEQIVKDSFAQILRGKTAIVVAHRLSTLSEMDRIVVIDHGRLIEDGTHRQLLVRNGLYAKLWKKQEKE